MVTGSGDRAEAEACFEFQPNLEPQISNHYMPNTPQYFFLASFVLTFSLLFFIQSQVSKFLASKDIKLVNLLLLGLPKDPQHPEMGSHSIQDFVKNLSQEDAIALVQTPAFLASAGLVAVTVIYLALFTGSQYFLSTWYLY